MHVSPAASAIAIGNIVRSKRSTCVRSRNQPPVKGRTSIESCLAGLPPVAGFTLRTTKIEGRDDLAYVQGTFALTVTPAGATAPTEESGYFLEVLRRQPNGQWLIAVQMFTGHQ